MGSGSGAESNFENAFNSDAGICIGSIVKLYVVLLMTSVIKFSMISGIPIVGFGYGSGLSNGIGSIKLVHLWCQSGSGTNARFNVVVVMV